MALSRFIVNNLTHTHKSPLKITPPSTLHLLHRFSGLQKPDTKELPISVSPRRRRRRRSTWPETTDRSLPAPLSGVGNAIVQAAANLNRLLGSLWPAHLIRKLKEKDERYSVKYEMPGLSKDDVRITVEDGVLFIRGEHREEEEGEGSDEEYWSAASYGFYDTSLMLPEDAKVEEIRAEMKDGVLHVIIPKDEEKKKKKNVKEVQVV